MRVVDVRRDIRDGGDFTVEDANLEIDEDAGGPPDDVLGGDVGRRSEHGKLDPVVRRSDGELPILTGETEQDCDGQHRE